MIARLTSQFSVLVAVLVFMNPVAAQAGQDPWLPPAARSAAIAPETRGADLQRQVLSKLEGQFRRADAAGRGAITLAEAQRAGWGFAVQNFGQLDSQHHGEIRIQDLQRFVQKRQPP